MNGTKLTNAEAIAIMRESFKRTMSRIAREKGDETVHLEIELDHSDDEVAPPTLYRAANLVIRKVAKYWN